MSISSRTGLLISVAFVTIVGLVQNWILAQITHQQLHNTPPEMNQDITEQFILKSLIHEERRGGHHQRQDQVVGGGYNHTSRKNGNHNPSRSVLFQYARPVEFLKRGVSIQDMYKFPTKEERYDLLNSGGGLLAVAVEGGSCSCRNPHADLQCCRRTIFRTHKMGCVMTESLFVKDYPLIQLATEPEHFTYLKQGLPQQDYRDVIVLRDIYDSLISGYMFHKSTYSIIACRTANRQQQHKSSHSHLLYCHRREGVPEQAQVERVLVDVGSAPIVRSGPAPATKLDAVPLPGRNRLRCRAARLRWYVFCCCARRRNVVCGRMCASV